MWRLLTVSGNKAVDGVHISLLCVSQCRFLCAGLTNDWLLPAPSLNHPPSTAPVSGYMILLSSYDDPHGWYKRVTRLYKGAYYCIPNGPGWAGHQGESLHTWLVKQTWGLAAETDSEAQREGNKIHNTAFDHCLKDTLLGFIVILCQDLSRGIIYIHTMI